MSTTRAGRTSSRTGRAHPGGLGERVLRLEHVGSTAVTGLVAKPRIDVLLVVANAADEPAYVPPLEATGYRLRIREPDWLRDHLRDHRADRELYAATKRALAARCWRHMQDYADAKTEIVEAILGRIAKDEPTTQR